MNMLRTVLEIFSFLLIVNCIFIATEIINQMSEKRGKK
jgi:large-conductance mechanosensitive channel